MKAAAEEREKKVRISHSCGRRHELILCRHLRVNLLDGREGETLTPIFNYRVVLLRAPGL
jgi:hypothetical protein